MATEIGTVGLGPLGFTADAVTRFDDLAALPFQHVDVVVKSYRARAHLLICRC